MTDSMTERVRKALSLILPEAMATNALAKAAIEAMREPTQAVLDAGADHMYDAIDFSPEEGEGIDGFDVTPVWRAMIDEALK